MFALETTNDPCSADEFLCQRALEWTDNERLAEFADVHVLAAPPDAEVIRSVVRSLERSRR